MNNAAPNAVTLARRAGVPCPPLTAENFSFVVWDDGTRWGHIDVTRRKVTVWNPTTGQHDRLPLA